jgi:hypothetical protein
VRYDPFFYRRSALFWPVARTAKMLEKDDWPSVALLSRLAGDSSPVRFEALRPRSRRRRLRAHERYDARITNDRVVSMREGSWHDLMNALVWSAFPQAKLALHARQNRLITARLGPDLRLPGSRTVEQDAIAMFDEGGVVLFRARCEATAPWSRDAPGLVAVFGHAIYEALAAETSRVRRAIRSPECIRAAGFAVDLERGVDSDNSKLAIADATLAAYFSRDAPITRDDFEAVFVETGASSWRQERQGLLGKGCPSTR